MEENSINKNNIILDRGAGTETYPEHDCYEWNHEHWCNQFNATYTKCGICGIITGFHYKSFLKRLKSAFNFKASSPIK